MVVDRDKQEVAHLAFPVASSLSWTHHSASRCELLRPIGFEAILKWCAIQRRLTKLEVANTAFVGRGCHEVDCRRSQGRSGCSRCGRRDGWR